jgi:hypothetical protein
LPFLSRLQSDFEPSSRSQHYLVIQRQWRAAWQDLELSYQCGQRAFDRLNSVFETCNKKIMYRMNANYLYSFGNVLRSIQAVYTNRAVTHSAKTVNVSSAIWRYLICAPLVTVRIRSIIQFHPHILQHLHMTDSTAYLILDLPKFSMAGIGGT